HERDDNAAPVEKALRRERLDQPAPDEHVVEHSVLGEERAHELPGDDERYKKWPSIEPSQDRNRARMPSEREVTSDRDRGQPDQQRREENDRQREQQVGRIEVERFREVLERERAVLAAKRDHR